MNIVNYNGSVLDSHADIILHQVNCKGVMGSGVAKAIRDKYPIVYEQYKYHVGMVEVSDSSGRALLGNVQIVTLPDGSDNKYVANLFGQHMFGADGKRYTSYDAVYDGLVSLRNYILSKNNGSWTIALPYKMSSDRGGADWDIIMFMIEMVFKTTDVTIEIWKYEK